MTFKKRLILYSILLQAVFALLAIPLLIPQVTTHKLIRVVDGDTFVVDVDGREEYVRLLFVDTAENKTEFGKATTAAVQYLLPPGTPLLLERDASEDRDRFGRLLRLVFIPGKITHAPADVDYANFNVWLVKTGWSKYYTKYGKSEKYDQDLMDAQGYAKGNKLGIWGPPLLERAE